MPHNPVHPDNAAGNDHGQKSVKSNAPVFFGQDNVILLRILRIIVDNDLRADRMLRDDFAALSLSDRTIIGTEIMVGVVWPTINNVIIGNVNEVTATDPRPRRMRHLPFRDRERWPLDKFKRYSHRRVTEQDEQYHRNEIKTRMSNADHLTYPPATIRGRTPCNCATSGAFRRTRRPLSRVL